MNNRYVFSVYIIVVNAPLRQVTLGPDTHAEQLSGGRKQHYKFTIIIYIYISYLTI